MWKDFFYFSKSQRVGIIILIVLIIIVVILNNTLSLFYPAKQTGNSEFISEVENFRKTLVSSDSLRQIEWQQMNEDRRREYESKFEQFQPYSKKTEATKYTLFKFDPNRLDSTGFVKLGLKPYVASNILKYRRKGGAYRTASDFSKVFGIQPEKFQELEAYISISEINDTTLKRNLETTKTIIVELNSADTSLLMQVKGIGRGYAKGIIRFRYQTGGFVSVEQLKEIYGMRPENYEKIKNFCVVNKALVKKININTATVEKLNAHPYLNFYQAKAIYELRRKKGKLNRKEDLIEINDISSENLEKISPYLSFE